MNSILFVSIKKFLPNLCGNSSQITAIEILIPLYLDSVNPTPIANPSIKLCKPSLNKTIQAIGETRDKSSFPTL
jgi:hypothetical protein